MGMEVIMDGANIDDYPTRNRGFHIAHLNMQSIRNKLPELGIYIKEMNFDVFKISETWLNSTFPNCLLNVDGYNLVRWDRNWMVEGMNSVKRGGGLAIFVKQELNFSTNKYEKFNKSTCDLELLWLSINMVNSKNVNIGVVYRPPSGKVNTCCNQLVDIVNDINSEDNADMFLLGDFNIDYLDKRSDPYKCLHRLELLTNLRQHIKGATRKDHCLDLIYSNCEIVSDSGVLDVMLSVHEMIFITRKKAKTTYNYVQFMGRSYRNYIKEDMRRHLANTDWEQYYAMNAPDECWTYLLGTITSKIDEMCPPEQTV